MWAGSNRNGPNFKSLESLEYFIEQFKKDIEKLRKIEIYRKVSIILLKLYNLGFDYLKISFILPYQTFLYTPSITVIFADLMVPILHRILMYLHGARFGFIRSNHPEIKPQIPTLSSLLRSSGLHLSIVYFYRVLRNNFIFECHISNLWLKPRLTAECI